MYAGVRVVVSEGRHLILRKLKRSYGATKKTKVYMLRSNRREDTISVRNVDAAVNIFEDDCRRRRRQPREKSMFGQHAPSSVPQSWF